MYDMYGKSELQRKYLSKWLLPRFRIKIRLVFIVKTCIDNMIVMGYIKELPERL